MVVGPVTPLKLRSGFVPFETFQSSKLGLSWNFGIDKVGQLVREASYGVGKGLLDAKRGGLARA